MDAKAVPSYKSEAKSILEQWRRRALTLTLVVTLIAGIPSLVTSTITGMETGELSLLISWATYSVLLLATFLTKIRYQIRVWVFLVAGLSTAAINIWLSGLSGTGGIYLIMMPVYAFILAGEMAGWIAMFVSLATFGVFTVLAGIGNMTWPAIANPNSLFRWIGAGAVGTMLMIIAVILLREYTRLQAKILNDIKLQAELLDAELDLVYLSDFEGTLLYVNKAAYLTHGYTKEELMKKKLAELKDTDSTKQSAPTMKGILENGQAIYEIEHRHNNGSLIPLEVHTSLIEIDGKKLIISLARDITERQKIQQQMIEQERLASVGQLAAGIAHELNNPMTSIIGFSDMLKGRKDLPSDAREEVELVNQEARRVAEIVKGLLTFARKQDLNKELVDVTSIILRVLKLRAYEHRLRNIDVDTRFAIDLPRFMASGSQLQQVFLNLVVNAEQAMIEAHQRGKLTITAEQPGDMLRYSFADNGPGISQENMDKLFTPFFTTKGVGKGTGLGLSICKGIITEHGGKLYAKSEAGKGATFIVELPVTREGR